MAVTLFDCHCLRTTVLSMRSQIRGIKRARLTETMKFNKGWRSHLEPSSDPWTYDKHEYLTARQPCLRNQRSKDAAGSIVRYNTPAVIHCALYLSRSSTSQSYIQTAFDCFAPLSFVRAKPFHQYYRQS